MARQLYPASTKEGVLAGFLYFPCKSSGLVHLVISGVDGGGIVLDYVGATFALRSSAATLSRCGLC